MKRLNIILTLSLCILATGCAVTEQKPNESQLRKAAMIGCVDNFLQQDVAPMDSLAICNTVYKRWDASGSGSKLNTPTAGGK